MMDESCHVDAKAAAMIPLIGLTLQSGVQQSKAKAARLLNEPRVNAGMRQDFALQILMLSSLRFKGSLITLSPGLYRKATLDFTPALRPSGLCTPQKRAASGGPVGLCPRARKMG
jgi:hypothetical protein